MKIEAICGGIGGAIGIVVGAPFDLVKVRMQVFPDIYKSSLVAFRDIVREEGVRGIFKGTLSPVAVQGLLNSLLFAGKYAVSKFLFPHNHSTNSLSHAEEYISGSCGGFLQCIVLVPSDVVKCRMQIDNISNSTGAPKMNGIMDCISQIYKSEGISGFYKGFWSTALREIPSLGTYFFTYQLLRKLWTPPGQETSHFVTLISGGLAGSASWAVVYPMDLIKSNIQISTANDGKPTSILGMARYLWSRHRSIGAFYQGIGPTVLRAFPVNAVTFYFYELIKKKLHLE